MAPSAPAPPLGLTVVVPTLDEESALGALLADLAAQRGLSLEVVIADGGSRDGTRQVVAEAAAKGDMPVRWVEAGRGRGRQLNAGARVANSPDLLFLHADSRLEDADLLRRAKDALDALRGDWGDAVAGHFTIRFLEARGHPLAFYFYEAKARTNLPETVNGDQGFLLSRRFFDALGGFDESLPYLEDARLARRVEQAGRWTVLPGTVGTSARRFSTEGFWKRQALNALVRAFDAIGREGFFAEAGRLYRLQASATALRLAPFLALAHRVTLSGGAAGWLETWKKTGGYVRDNAWQLAFARDCRRNFRRGLAPGQGPTPSLRRHLRFVRPLLGGGIGAALAAAATLAAFYTLWLALALFERGAGNET